MLKSMFAMMLGLAACQSTMMNDEEAMRGQLEDARLETTRHLAAARTATTMTDVRDEMTLHRDGMAPMMSDIDATMEGMRSHCDGSGLSFRVSMRDLCRKYCLLDC